ncbi:MAG: hypothetical protein RIR53_1565 [Bacteroidota bacterium]|jgi:hypothetical protein
MSRNRPDSLLLKIICLFYVGTTVSLISLSAQSIDLFDIDASAFPIMKAKFYAFDEQGTPQRPTAAELTLSEDGAVSTIIGTSCPPVPPLSVLSSVLIIDVSGSMSSQDDGAMRIDLAKAAARAWVTGLPPGKNECAIASFDTESYMIQDYTIDRRKLLAAIEQLRPQGGTDYDAALINPMAGGLVVSSRGRNKRVIVMLTDGRADRPNVEAIVAEAKRQSCQIYFVTLNMPAPQVLKDIADQTGGRVFENVTTISQAEQVYRSILRLLQAKVSCEITWQSRTACQEATRLVEISFQGRRAQQSYVVPSNRVARLEFSPLRYRFYDPIIGSDMTQDVIVTARNATFTVKSIVSSAASFTISPESFTLQPNESRKLVVRYRAVDSSLTFCRFDFTTDVCEQTYFTSGGYHGGRPKNPDLRLKRPNGGESFVVGTDTLIEWEGLPRTELVNLDISPDNGVSWYPVAEKVSGLSYPWKNIPRPTGQNYRIRVIHPELSGDIDPLNPAPECVWQRTLGGSLNDEASTILESASGGLIVAGNVESNDLDVVNKRGGFVGTNRDSWIAALDANGAILWQRSYGGTGNDGTSTLIETADGSLVFTGGTMSTDLDVTDKRGGADNSDLWVTKVNSRGVVLWKRVLGGTSADEASSIIEASDGTLWVAGETSSNDVDVAVKRGDAANKDVWVIKLDAMGNLLWEKTIGGSNVDGAADIVQSADGSIVMAGSTSSNTGDVQDKRGGLSDSDIWVVKLNVDGSIVWQKTLGGSRSDFANSIVARPDGSLLVAGTTESVDIDVTSKRGGQGNYDVWLMKLDANGTLLWQKTLGGTLDDFAASIIETKDGSLILAASTRSKDLDVSGRRLILAESDVWVVKLTADGQIVWQRTLGGSMDDVASSIIETSDESYVVAGFTSSRGIDVQNKRGGSGNKDFWVFKLSSNGVVLQSDYSDTTFAIVEPIASSRDVEMGQVLVGKSKDSVIVDLVRNLGSYGFSVRSIGFRGADSMAFRLISGLPEYSVAPNSVALGELSFRPTRTGLHQAEMVIVTQSDTIVHNIRGFGVAPSLQIVNSIINFGPVLVRTSKDSLGVTTLRNVGSSAMNILGIRHGPPNDVDFSTLAGSGAVVLQPGDSLTMNLRFLPRDVGRTSGRLEFSYNGLGSPATVQLYGEGVVPDTVQTTITLPDITARAGELFPLALSITQSSKLERADAPVNFTATIALNPTVVHVTDPSLTCQQVDVNTCRYVLSGRRTNDTVLVRIPAMATLGTTGRSPLQIISFDWLDSLLGTDVTTRDGSVTITGICEEGGVRLFVPGDAKFSLASRPNPVSSTMDLHFGLAEPTGVNIRIVDYTGQTVLTPVQEPLLQPGAYVRSVDVSALAPGPYIVVLTSANISLQTRMDVVR